MSHIFTLRTMYKDVLNRKNLKESDLDAETQGLIGQYSTKETSYNAKVSAWEAAKTTYESLQQDLLNERGDLASLDSQIHHKIVMIRPEATPKP